MRIIIACLIALLPITASARVIHLNDDDGGLIIAYVHKFVAAAQRGDRVIIDGYCLSACTVALGVFQPDHICATPNAVLGFHAAWWPTPWGIVPSPVGTHEIVRWYPPAIREWIARHGGLRPEMIFLRGPELLAIVPECKWYMSRFNERAYGAVAAVRRVTLASSSRRDFGAAFPPRLTLTDGAGGFFPGVPLSLGCLGIGQCSSSYRA